MMLDYPTYFTGKTGCFILFDANKNEVVTQYHEERCQKQFDVLKKLVSTGKLPYIETSPKGLKLYGITDSAYDAKNPALRVGSFSAFTEKDQGKKTQRYFMVLNFADKKQVKNGATGGDEAKELTTFLLKRLRYY